MSGSTMVFARPGGFRRVTASVASAALFASVGLPPVAFAQGGGAQPIIVEGDQVDGRLQEAVACPSAPQLIAFQRVLDRGQRMAGRFDDDVERRSKSCLQARRL